MTVAELIEELQKMPAHQPVIFESEDGILFVDGVGIRTNLSFGCAVTILGE